MSDDSFNPYPWGPHGARQDGPGPPAAWSIVWRAPAFIVSRGTSCDC